MNCENKSPFIPALNEAELTDGMHCAVDFARELMEIAKMESCGKCVLCREGSWQAYEIIKDITEGNGESEDYDLLKEILEMIRLYSGCEMSRNAASQCLELLIVYQNEWDFHIRKKKCSNLICKHFFKLYIDPEVCTGCGHCISVCPVGAIEGSDDMIHMLNADICNKCMECVDSCPQKSIKKYGSMKPEVPIKLVPVGSFSVQSHSSELGTSMRRRRKSE